MVFDRYVAGGLTGPIRYVTYYLETRERPSSHMSSQEQVRTTSPQFRHERIDGNPPCGRLTFCLPTDLTGNGRDDIIVGGMGSRHNVYLDGKSTRIPSLAGIRDRLGFPEANLFWYENPGWKRHEISVDQRLGVGHTLADIDGDGRVDIVAGSPIHLDEVYWFHQPKDPRRDWQRYSIIDEHEKYHDLTVADVDDDGEPEVVGLSQKGEAMFYCDVPANARQSPWPSECHQLLDDDVSVEGLAVLDVDGDGRTEILAGTNVYHRVDDAGRQWERESILPGWDDVRVATGDLDGDGDPEVVFAEGDSPTYGTHMGRVAWCDPNDWEPQFLKHDLFCPHSLQLADFTGNGRLDVFVGEMDLGENDVPELFVFVNDGDGQFSERVVSRGIATHEAKVADLTGDGRADVVGKSYTPDHHVDVWYNDG